MAIMSMSPNLFSSPPPNPRINESPSPESSLPVPSLPVPKRRNSNPNPNPKSPKHSQNAIKQLIHTRTKYYKPIPKNSSSSAIISGDGERSVVVGESGISYLLPDAPFEYQFSYSETPKARPLAMKEPAFLPFGPRTMGRPWTGKAPLMSKKEKERKRKKVRLFEAEIEEEEEEEKEEAENDERLEKKTMVVKRVDLGKWSVNGDGRSREEILGKPLTRREVREMVKPLLSKNRQLNLGRDGLTHNMLEMIHTHWKRQEVCKVRCRGVPTVDMDNVCHHLEEKSGGKIIHRIGGVVYLFRGRNYNPRTRPQYPLMLWKPAAPVYPKLIQDAPEGLTKQTADEFRRKGKQLLPICKLAKNGIYINLVRDVRDAFEGSPLVKINCQGMHASDYKKLGAKLKELVPCVLLSFDDEQILMWRGNDWKPRYREPAPIPSVPKLNLNDTGTSSDVEGSSKDIDDESIIKQEAITPKMFLLWKRAIDSHKALLLDDNTELSPDSLLQRVEEFQGTSQAAEHSYPALIVSGDKGAINVESSIDNGDEDEEVKTSGEFDDYEIDVDDSFEEVDPLVGYGSLPVDSIAKRLNPE